MAVGVDVRGESYGLLIDQIGEVLKLADDRAARTKPGQSRSAPGQASAAGVHRLDGQLMVVLDVDRVLDIVPDRRSPRNAADETAWKSLRRRTKQRLHENMFGCR